MGLFREGMYDFCRHVGNRVRNLQHKVVKGMHMLQGKILVALPLVTVIMVVGIPEVCAHKSVKRNRVALFSSKRFVQTEVLQGDREFAQLAEVRSGQETAKQEIKCHKLSNVLHGDDLKSTPKVVLVL